MAKLTPQGLAINVPLDQIKDYGNVRMSYDQQKIQELAESILRDGLLNPITLKRDEPDEFGNPHYELICGHRRLLAYKYLVEQGQNFTAIPACIRTGDTLRLQLIENIQRENLDHVEMENALHEMMADGMSQTEIAKELSKPASWVSDMLAGSAVREKAEKAGIDTTGISTKTLSEFRAMDEESAVQSVSELKEQGGSYRTAAKIRKAKTNKTSEPKPVKISVQDIVDELIAYRERISKCYDTANSKGIINRVTEDLLAIFRAYEG